MARERGYVSVDTRQRLRDLGFADAQCRVPGLLIPIRDTTGGVGLHQYRPDEPRQIDGRPVKYETPAGSRVVVDVSELALRTLHNPRTPLVVTEGARKVDALASAGLSAIGLLGVSAWRSGGVALPDLLDIVWSGRRTLIAFDSDVMVKPAVQRELLALTRYPQGEGRQR
ncbi:MAG TPA: DUF3854 domain-containing protein [Mycobacteriales bacterium]|nr:DUF3854 domain-containing protein [Mycobacteriales bacterium]